MVFVRICGNLLSNSPWAPEVVGIEATIGCPLATLPSKEIYSPLLIHIASKLYIPEDQITLQLCYLRHICLVVVRFLSSLFSVIIIMIDDVLSWDVEFKSMLPINVGHKEFFPFKHVVNKRSIAGDLCKVSVTESEVSRN